MADVVNDTFTDSDGTQLVSSHTGETGATWTMNLAFGVGNNGALVIHSNAIRRPTFAENPAADGSECLAYPSGLLPGGTNHFIVEFGVVFDDDSNSAYVQIFEKSDGGSYATLAQIANAGYGGPGAQIFIADGVGGYTNAGFSPTIGYEYPVKLEFNGTSATFYLDSVSVATITRSSGVPIEPFGVDIYDSTSIGNCHVTYMRVYAAGPPDPFWTKYVLTTEATA